MLRPEYMGNRRRVQFPLQAQPSPLAQPTHIMTLDWGAPPDRIPRIFNPALTMYDGLKMYGFGLDANGINRPSLLFGAGMYREAPGRSPMRTLSAVANEGWSADRRQVPAAYVGGVRR